MGLSGTQPDVKHELAKLAGESDQNHSGLASAGVPVTTVGGATAKCLSVPHPESWLNLPLTVWTVRNTLVSAARSPRVFLQSYEVELSEVLLARDQVVHGTWRTEATFRRGVRAGGGIGNSETWGCSNR